MKRSRTEVGRWRMLRQASRRKARWLEGQSRRNMRIPKGHRWRCPMSVFVLFLKYFFVRFY